MEEETRTTYLKKWHRAVKMCQGWEKNKMKTKFGEKTLAKLF